MKRTLSLSLFVCLLAVAAGASRAQPADPAWAPPKPADKEKDWIQLVSGEWLRGDLQMIDDGDVEFDSDELDDLVISFSDVAELRSPRMHTYRFEGRRIFTGTAAMAGGKISIDTGSEVLEFDRALLVGMVEGEPKELNFWSGKFTLGFSAKQGNSESTDFSVYANLQRRTALTRFDTQYDGYIRTTDGDSTDNNHRVASAFDYFLTRRLFVRTPSFEFYTDKFQNIDTRLTTGASVGYEVFKNKWLLWDVSAGAAYQYTSFISVQTGSNTANDAAVIFGTSFETELTKDLEWDTSYTAQVVATDIDKTNHNLQTVLSFDIWGPLDLDVTFNFDRIESPTARADGTIPQSNDYRTSVGVGIDF